jgi:hypothetical protein
MMKATANNAGLRWKDRACVNVCRERVFPVEGGATAVRRRGLRLRWK